MLVKVDKKEHALAVLGAAYACSHEITRVRHHWDYWIKHGTVGLCIDTSEREICTLKARVVRNPMQQVVCYKEWRRINDTK